MSQSKIKVLVILLLLAFVLAVIVSGRLDKKEVLSNSSSEKNTSKASSIDEQEINITEPAALSVQTKSKNSPVSSKMESRYKTLSDNESYPTLESRLQAMSERNNKVYEPEAVLDAMANRNGWAQSANPPKTMPLTEVELHDGREFVAVDRLKIESLFPGDSLTLPVGQKHTAFDINIVTVDKNPNGSLTWHGEIKRNNESYFVEITQSDSLTLAGISTPDGNFALQANGGEGWLATTDTLFKRNEHISDALTPPDTISPPHSQ